MSSDTNEWFHSMENQKILTKANKSQDLIYEMRKNERGERDLHTLEDIAQRLCSRRNGLVHSRTSMSFQRSNLSAATNIASESYTCAAHQRLLLLSPARYGGVIVKICSTTTWCHGGEFPRAGLRLGTMFRRERQQEAGAARL
jgi:hypothetical protein